MADYIMGTVIDRKFVTIDDTGLPATLAGSPAVSVYKANSTTQSTAGVTLTVDFDGVTGQHHVRIDTSADPTFYSTGSDFDVALSAGTVDGVSVVGYQLFHFSIEKEAAYLLAGSASYGLSILEGLVDDLESRIGTPSNLGGGATIAQNLADIEAQTDDIGAAGAGLTALGDARLANLDATVSSRLATSGYTAPLSAAGVRSAVGLASANLDTQLAAIDDAVDSEIASIAGDITTLLGRLTAQRATNLDELSAANIPADVDTLLARLTSARALLLDNLDATVSSRATPAQVATELATYDAPTFAELDARTDAIEAAIAGISGGGGGLDAAGVRAAIGLAAANLDTQLAALDTLLDSIKADTDPLPADPADASDIAASFASIAATLATLATAANLAAVKAKTDSLTFDVAGAVNSNATHVNDTPLTGTGVLGDEWGPA